MRPRKPTKLLVLSWLELQNEFSAECPADAVEIAAEAIAVDIVLHFARIEMIQDVEHAESHLGVLVDERKLDPLLHLQIDGSERRKALAVARSDVLALLILDRIGEASMHVNDGRECNAIGSRKIAPEQKPIGRVEGQAGALVRLDHHLLRVPKELVEVVQIAERFGVHIRRVQQVPSWLITTGDLEFTVTVEP